MATITKQEIIDSLRCLGQLAHARGEQIELVLMGGALMVLLFGERDSTRDLDVLILAPPEASRVRELARIVAAERGWPDDWLNDAAKAYLVGVSFGEVVYSAPGIEVSRPAFAQLLAMKLSAWRDEVDISDARRLLIELPRNREESWQMVSEYLVRGSELKSQYAFDDLWEAIYGKD